MATGIRILLAATVAALALSAASARAAPPGDGASPRSAPAANPASIQTRAPGTDSALVRPSTESDDVTRLLLELLAGLVVLVVIPLQVAKGVASRRREAALASARARRPRRRR